METTGLAEVGLLRDYLQRGKLMQLATRDTGGRPWLVHVWYAVGPNLELVFASNVARLHSGHINAGSAVAGGVIAIELEGLGQRVRGVTFTGSARECSGNDLLAAYTVYSTRWPNAHELFPLSHIVAGDSPMRIYEVVPDQFVLFDEENFGENPRRVITEW